MKKRKKIRQLIPLRTRKTIRQRIPPLQKIRNEILKHINIPDKTIPCIIFRRGGSKKGDTGYYYSRQSLVSCISKFRTSNEELEKLYPDCIGCKRWIEHLDPQYYGEVFGDDEEKSKPKKRKRRKLL